MQVINLNQAREYEHTNRELVAKLLKTKKEQKIIIKLQKTNGTILT